jgi:hypothetical protein
MRTVRLPVLSSGCLACLLVAGVARADGSTIRMPGDHTSYVFEIEPHGILGFGAPFEDTAAEIGLGVRGTLHLANGFIPSINDSVGVGFGIDFTPGGDGRVLIPIVLQWNFWLSNRFSVFGEPGFAVTSGGPQTFDPFIFYAGGRFLFTPRIGFTVRVGYPDVSVGVSFLL